VNVLVLGAQEFIGNRVLLALTRCGWARPIAETAAAARFDPTHPGDLVEILKGADAVVNCLSSQPGTIEAAAAALFETAARSAAPPLIVHLSSMSVYGAAVGEVTEDAPLREGLTPYAQAKVRAERHAAGYSRKIILRPGCEYGPGGELWSGRIAEWLYQRRIGDLGAGGDGYCNLVYIDDLVSAVLECLRQPAAIGKCFNLGMRDPPTWNEYFVAYAKALGAVPVKRVSNRSLSLETKLLAAPLKALQLAAAKLGAARRVPAPMPPSLLRLFRQEIKLDSMATRRELGWQCRTLDHGLAETAACYSRADRKPSRAPP
jgi:nucleoside-diphosphate-sugar epimerase